MMNDEQVLVEGAMRRDRQAFGKLYDRYVDPIYRYVYHKTGQRADEAEDLTAQVFLKAWEAMGKYKWEGYPFSSFLYRIAHNMVIDYYRTFHETFELNVAVTRSGGTDPHEAAEKTLVSEEVREALTHLRPLQRRVIVLRFLEGYDCVEIGRMLGKEPDAIRALQHRALLALQAYFDKQGKAEARQLAQLFQVQAAPA
jgi:RNA polymerase sigma-70 factor, ECF subfamily